MVRRLYLLDTNMVSYIAKGRSKAARLRLAGLEHGEVAGISAITEAEVLYGMAKASLGEHSRRAVESFLSRLKVYAWDGEAAAAYGPLRARQETAGRSLGPLDTQIAAHAIALGATLVSSDQAFRQVEGLAGLEDWAIDLEAVRRR